MWLIAALAVAVVGVACFGQAGVETQPTTRPDAEKMTLFELLLMGRWFMVPIGLCSLLGLAIVIERLVALRHSVVVPRGFLDGLKRVFRDTRHDRAKGLEFCRQWDCPIGRVIAAGIARFNRGRETVERAMEDAGAAEIQKLRRHLQMLFGVAGASPMLGLLGTVWGMIEAFQTASVKGLGQAEHLATGIYKALVTTFAGLVVAIPALMFYYYFRGKIEQIVSGLNEVSIEFAEHYLARDEDLQPPARSVKAAGAAPVAMIKFNCAACGAVLTVPRDNAGKKGTCPRCKSAVAVPALPPVEGPMSITGQGEPRDVAQPAPGARPARAEGDQETER